MKNTGFIALIISISLSITMSSCTKGLKNIKGSGPVVSQSFELPNITGVASSIDADVVITYADSQSVRIVGQQNIINNIEKYVDNGVWRIGYYYGVRDHAGVTIYITTNEMSYVTISGSGDIESTNVYPDSTNVYINISGSGNINLSTIASYIDTDISGSGNVYLAGSAYEHRIDISGSGDIHAFALDTKNTFVKISGSGNCEVLVQDYLDVNISGSGDIYYQGNPDINANISGSGNIIKY